MSSGAISLLERAIHEARSGTRHPHHALIQAGDYPENVNVDSKVPMDPAEAEALLALMRMVEPLTIQQWFEQKDPSLAETAELLAEVLFKMQLEG